MCSSVNSTSHHIERRNNMKLRLTDYNDNTYMDTALSWALVDKTA
nr:MAG TPA: hypothetical protein [Caudoviricetes sp.]